MRTIGTLSAGLGAILRWFIRWFIGSPSSSPARPRGPSPISALVWSTRRMLCLVYRWRDTYGNVRMSPCRWYRHWRQLDMFPGTWGCPRHVRFACHTYSMHIQSTKAKYRVPSSGVQLNSLNLATRSVTGGALSKNKPRSIWTLYVYDYPVEILTFVLY